MIIPELAVAEPRVPRRLRVQGELHQELAGALKQLEDPRLADLTVTRVEMTDDLQLARVFVRLGAGTDEVEDADKRRELMRGLRSAAGRLRRHSGEVLRLRYTPELRFVYDEGYDAARRVDAILEELGREQKER